ncbi:MAG: HD-GYP domain-containing protein [Spirochaetaceae bacterium]|nr:HD-GYP domain-containing protein [Spirochaetaceae bacterium]
MEFSKKSEENLSEIYNPEYEEPEELNEYKEGSDEGLVNTLQILSWRNRYKNVPIPTMILDNSLKVIWFNSSFNQYFDSETERKFSHLTDYFSNLKDIEKLKNIYNSLTQDNSGYTWQGRVTSKNRRRRSDVANLMITPLDLNDDGTPHNFTGILDIITDEYREMLRNMFSSLLEASKLKDNDTGNHIERVNRYSKFIAEDLIDKIEYPEIDEDFIEDIGFLAAMHDVGKIGTPDDILNKSGSLEIWERDVMNEHTKNGAYILSTYPNPMAKQIALSHHEKWDGSGYPFGMANQMIPLCARIVALADVYDALRMKRSYKESFSHEKTKEIIVNLSGTHFDPDLIKCFQRNDEHFDKIFSDLTDEGKK